MAPWVSRKAGIVCDVVFFILILFIFQEPERRSSVSGQGAQAASSPSQAAGLQQTSNSQNSDGKHFLGMFLL